MTPRDAFLDACARLGATLTEAGFRSSQKGQTWKKKTRDRTFEARVYFQSSTLSSPRDVALVPHVSVHAQALKKWWLARHPGAPASDTVWAAPLAHLREPGRWLTWNVAGPRVREASVAEVAKRLREEAFPVFDCFEDCPALIRRLRSRRFATKDGEHEVLPVDVMLCFGTKDDAQAMLDGYFAARPPTPNVKALLAALRTADESAVRLGRSEFHGAHQLKLAHVHGLRLPAG